MRKSVQRFYSVYFSIIYFYRPVIKPKEDLKTGAASKSSLEAKERPSLQ